MHHLLKDRILPVLAGAAVVVAGLNLASYAANGDSARYLGRTATRTNPFGAAGVHTASTTGSARTQAGAYVYRIPKATTLPFLIRLKGVPAGKYAASFDIGTISASGPIAPFCYVADSVSTYSVVSYGQDIGAVTRDVAVSSASGIVKLVNNNDVAIGCNYADHTFQKGGSKNVVVLTPLHHVVTTKGHPLPVPKTAFSR
jgi:hypothetical protein